MQYRVIEGSEMGRTMYEVQGKSWFTFGWTPIAEHFFESKQEAIDAINYTSDDHVVWQSFVKSSD